MPIRAPAVSVILPTLNRAELLPTAIGSVLAQSFTDFEIIVVDDGSTQDLRPVIEDLADDRVQLVRRDTNGGVSAARNTGIRAARGQWLAFQDSDDQWLADKLQRQLAAVQTGLRDVMCICGMLRTGVRLHHGIGAREGQGLNCYPRRPEDWSQGLDHRGVLRAASAYTQTWLVPRQAVLDAGCFDERLPVWEDWDLLIRLSQQLSIRLQKVPLVLSRRADDSLSVAQAQFVEAMAIILDKHASQLQRFRAEHALLLYKYAIRLFRAGSYRRCRLALLESLRRTPLRPGAWRLLLLSAAMPALGRLR